MEYVEITRRDGQRVRLRYGFRSLRWLEEQTGATFQRLFESLGQSTSATDIAWLVAAALYHEQPGVTPADADDLIDDVGLPAVVEAIGAAINASSLTRGLEGDGVDGAGPKLLAEAGTGTSSSARRRG